MTINPATGLLDQAAQRASPNWDTRPPDTALELIVIHGISLPPGEFGGRWIDDLFLNRLDPDQHAYFRAIYRLKVSAHVLIRRAGEIVQYVPFQHRAWHAGRSCFQGRERCNDFAVGIELEGCDDIPYTEAQYAQLALLIRALRRAYPSLRQAPAAIVGHSDIAPGRKTDPGAAFDWLRLHTLLSQHPP